MKNIFVIVIIVFTGVTSWAQKSGSVTLDDCYQNAISNYPNFKQTELNNAIYEINNKNTGINYYPSLYLNGQASLQSDVTKINIPAAAGFKAPEIAKDWYKINFDVQQLIYDGGVTAGQKELNATERDISNQEIQIELYQLKEKVNHLFFNVIFLKKNIEVLEVLVKNLAESLNDAQSAYNNGVILKSEVDKLKVELIKVEQKIIEKRSDSKAVILALNEITKLDIQNAKDLETPSLAIDNYTFVNNRPEYLMLDKQQNKIAVAKSLTSTKRRPKFLAFGQAGYGRPGYDMLNNDFTDYYMIGARLNWNIWDWNKVKNEKQIFDIQNEIINSKKRSFDQNLRADLFQRIESISKYRKLLNTDEAILELQNNIVQTALSQFNNGTITSTTYLIELNKLSTAKLNLEAHKLQLVFAKYQYLSAIGNL